MNVRLYDLTGIVGLGVPRECLLDTDVDVVQTVGRTPTGVQHPKIREVVQKDVHGLR
jgi:RNase P/RNase MRP subunit p30